MSRELKNVAGLRITSVAVVNQTPGSRRQIPTEQLGAEIERMAGPRLAARLSAARVGPRAG